LRGAVSANVGPARRINGSGQPGSVATRAETEPGNPDLAGPKLRAASEEAQATWPQGQARQPLGLEGSVTDKKALWRILLPRAGLWSR
jgi:hypothetical protein